MACKWPIDAFRPANGGPIRFKPPSDGRAYTPIQIPCGYCILCREEHARQAAVRIVHESMMHDRNCFITLSYNDTHLPTHNGLQYSDLRKFIKRMRNRMGKFRFYAVGEYGDRSMRPHYHACVFGMDFTEDMIVLKEKPHRLWTSPYLEEAWGLGMVSVGALTFETARYTASYVTKKLKSKQQYVRVDEETGELIPLEQPRAVMSDNIGKEWWKLWRQGVEDHDRVIINGRPQKPPKAYDKWLKESNEQKMEEIKTARKKKAKKSTAEQRHARAENAHAKIRQKSKKV